MILRQKKSASLSLRLNVKKLARRKQNVVTLAALRKTLGIQSFNPLNTDPLFASVEFRSLIIYIEDQRSHINRGYYTSGHILFII